jgi:thioredoxin-like negative regulator of GroEL
MYWGAVWCPPCNQLKATLFKRPDFIARMRSLVPVYIDGDAPGAQHLGARFKVRGYPTTLLFHPDGREITRLPGEVDPERYLQALETANRLTRTIRGALDAALAGDPALPVDEWRQLAYYAWETDEKQLAGSRSPAELVQRLAARCVAAAENPTPRSPELPALCTRLTLKSLSLAAQDHDKIQVVSPVAIDTLRRVLADGPQVRANLDLLQDSPEKVVRTASTGDPALAAGLAAAWVDAMASIEQDPTLAVIDRLAAIGVRLALAHIDDDKAPLSPELLATARAAVADADAATSDANERQSVISAAADVLIDAGLLDEAETLLTAELGRSHSPYYFMLGLADIAKRRGDKTGALDWYAKAHDAARGPATRLQWGASHVRALIELTPEDGDTIRRVANAVLGEIRPVAASFQGRNRAVLERMGTQLATWGREPAHAAAWAQLHSRWMGLCQRLPATIAERSSCEKPIQRPR